MQVSAKQPIEKCVARGLVFRRRRLEPAMVDRKVARKAELCRRGRDLALAVRLHDAARDDRISAARDGLMQDIVELAQLVAAEAQPGRILALDPEPRPAEVSREPLHRLERGRQLR
jgi:hypothetical protein